MSHMAGPLDAVKLALGIAILVRLTRAAGVSTIKTSLVMASAALFKALWDARAPQAIMPPDSRIPYKNYPLLGTWASGWLCQH